MSSVRQKAAIFERHGQANGSVSPHAQYNGSTTEGGHEQAETTAPNTGDGYMSKAEMRKRGMSRHSITSGDDADVYPPKAPLNKNVSWSSRPHPNAVQGSGIAALEEKVRDEKDESFDEVGGSSNSYPSLSPLNSSPA